MARSKTEGKIPGVTRRGATWRVRIRRGGFGIDQVFDTQAAAARFRADAVHRIDGDEYQDRTRERTTTFRDLLARYLKEVTPTKRGAIQEGVRLRSWMEEPFAALPLTSVASGHFAAWRDAKVKAGRAPSTISNAMNVVSAVFRLAKSEWGLDIANPLVGVRRPPPNPARTARLTAEDEARLLAACAAGPDWLAPIVRIALATAMRQGEIRGVRWEEVDLAGKTIRLSRTKNGRARDVPLLPEAEAALCAAGQPATAERRGLVFARAGRPLSQQSVSRAFGQAAGIAGLPDLTFHDLRHVATTRLAELHDNIIDLSLTTGHSDPKQLARYYNPDPAERAARIRARQAGQVKKPG